MYFRLAFGPYDTRVATVSPYPSGAAPERHDESLKVRWRHAVPASLPLSRYLHVAPRATSVSVTGGGAVVLGVVVLGVVVLVVVVLVVLVVLVVVVVVVVV